MTTEPWLNPDDVGRSGIWDDSKRHGDEGIIRVFCRGNIFFSGEFNFYPNQ